MRLIEGKRGQTQQKDDQGVALGDAALAASGAITTAAWGGVIGTTFGPVGSAVGGIAGAIAGGAAFHDAARDGAGDETKG